MICGSLVVCAGAAATPLVCPIKMHTCYADATTRSGVARCGCMGRNGQAPGRRKAASQLITAVSFILCPCDELPVSSEQRLKRRVARGAMCILAAARGVNSEVLPNDSIAPCDPTLPSLPNACCRRRRRVACAKAPFINVNLAPTLSMRRLCMARVEDVEAEKALPTFGPQCRRNCWDSGKVGGGRLNPQPRRSARPGDRCPPSLKSCSIAHFRDLNPLRRGPNS